MSKQPTDPRPKPAEIDFESAGWARHMMIDHAGEELSFELTIASDGCSFTAVLRDGTNCTTTVSLDGAKRVIDYVFPSVEGTTIVCVTTEGEEIYFDTETGAELGDAALQKRNPHFYT